MSSLLAVNPLSAKKSLAVIALFVTLAASLLAGTVVSESNASKESRESRRPNGKKACCTDDIDKLHLLAASYYMPVELGEFKLLVPSVAFTVKVTETGYEDWYYKSVDEGQKTSSLLLEPNTTKHLLIALQRIKRAK